MHRKISLLVLLLLILFNIFCEGIGPNSIVSSVTMAEYNFSYVLNFEPPFTKVYFTRPEPYDTEVIPSNEIIPVTSVDSNYMTTILYNMVLESNVKGSYELSVKATHFEHEGLEPIHFEMVIYPESSNGEVAIESGSEEAVKLSDYPLVVDNDGLKERILYPVSYKFDSDPFNMPSEEYCSTVTIDWSVNQ